VTGTVQIRSSGSVRSVNPARRAQRIIVSLFADERRRRDRIQNSYVRIANIKFLKLEEEFRKII
jgi:hypothetical protein